MDDIIQNSYHKSPLGYNNIDCFVSEVLNLENKMALYFENTKKEINMTEENEKDYKNSNSCRFCKKNNESDKVRDLCHLTGKKRGPSHNTCNINVTQKQSNFISL